MKRSVWILFLILFASQVFFSCVLAQEKKEFEIKQLFNKFSIRKEAGTQKVSSEESYADNKQAILFYNSNEINKAFEIILSVPEDKRTAQDWVLLGNILQDQEKDSDAIFMYQRAILVSPQFYKPYYNLANMYLQEEKPFLAIENYKKAINSNPQFPYSFYNLGNAYLMTGDLKKAKYAFLKAIELKNTEPDFHYNLAYTYKKLNKPKLAKQYLDYYHKALEAKGEI